MTAAPSPEQVEAARTPAGGWTRAQLAEWGVSWPPPKGWRRRLLAEYEAQAASPHSTSENRNTP
jgi:hypothetical protein